MSTTIAIICSLFLLPVLLTGLPIAFSILLICLAYMLTVGSDPTMPITTMFWFLNSSSLVAIPFFILAAEILARSGATDALVNASHAVLGRARNGLALVTVVAIMVFSAISGSSVATAVAIGRVMIPKLIEDGYKPRHSHPAQRTADRLCRCSGDLHRRSLPCGLGPGASSGPCALPVRRLSG